MTALAVERRPATSPPPISVNGTIVSRAAITREVQYHPAATPAASFKMAAEALVLRELLLQEARRRGVEAVQQVDDKGRRETEEEALVRGLVESEVRVPEPQPNELRRYYHSNPAKFRSPDIVEARHILIAAPASDAAAYAAARDKAEAVARLLAAASGSFDELARRYSDCASAGEGGVLGQIVPGETTPEFESALASMTEGETTRLPVATRYGFHLIRIDRLIAGTLLPFEAVAPRIAGYLAERARRLATAQYMARLVSRARITGIAIAGAEAFRVS
jgi:peptidyl-prolyl cis-trans isomerase C